MGKPSCIKVNCHIERSRDAACSFSTTLELTHNYRRAFLFFLLISLTLLSNLYPQQQFQKLYARYVESVGSAINGTTQLADGSYLMAGGLDTACHNCDFGSNALAIKTDAYGDTIWTRIMSGVRSETFNNALQMKDGNYLFVGSTESFGKQATLNVYGQYLYAVKTKPDGDTLWTRIYGGTNTDYAHNNYLFTTRVTPDGGFMMAGIVCLSPSSPYDNYGALLIKCDMNGDTTWTKLFTSINIADFEVLPDSGYVITGVYDSSGQENAFIAKLDKTGNMQWVKQYGGANYDVFIAVQHFANGDLLGAGQTSSFQPSSNCMYVCRLNNLGDTIWTKMYGPIYSVESMKLLNDTTFALFGLDASTGITATVGDARTGNLFYTQSYQPNNAFAGVSVTNDGGFILSTNNFYYGNGYPEGYVIKADASGNSGCHQQAFNLPAYPTQTQVSTGTLQTTYFPIYVNSTKTQITSGIQIGTLCTNGIQQFAGNKNELTIWPNPVNDVLNVECNEKINNTMITDVLGKEVLRTKEKEVDVSGLENGVYFIEVKTTSGRFTQKIIVQH